MKIFLSTILTFFLTFSVAQAAYVVQGTLSTEGSIPKAPTPVTVNPSGDTAISITWTAVAGVEGYKVYRKKNSENFVLIATVTTTSHTDSGLNDGTYAYQVQSFLGALSQNLNDIIPTAPITITIPTSPTPTPSQTPTPTPTPASGGGGGGPSGPVTTTSTADITRDGRVDILDFNLLVVNWGNTPSNPNADINGDGVVDILDFNLLIAGWSA